MVGYPNVGKSSTINALVGEKKVAVTATPGKTKHFQVRERKDREESEGGCLCEFV
jgi:large subunit GTPase 1